MSNYKTFNNYKVTFKDGKTLVSGGSAERNDKSSIRNEFDWVAFHMEKEIVMYGKTLADVERVDYYLEYKDHE